MPLKLPALQIKPRDVLAYKLVDDFSGLLVCLMVVFSPWAFGTTVPWAIWTMNAAGYALGAMWAVKLAVRTFKNYQPPRWTPPCESSSSTRILGALTVLILLYCLIAALNARATFLRSQFRFEYYECLRWLPHSLDSRASWSWFWNYLALACGFWAARDWLTGKTTRDMASKEAARSALPQRLRLLLWVLAINGLLLGLEGIAQRLEGSGRLLFILKPRVNPGAAAQFGPWAYRGSAASFFNLLWPVCLGFWWTLQHRSSGSGAHRHLLLVCAAVMAACPFISTSRGGAVVALALICASILAFGVISLGSRQRRAGAKSRAATFGLVLAFSAGAVLAGYHYGWKNLAARMDDRSMREGFAIRDEMNFHAWPMARDYPLFGTGPGTFEPVFQLYRKTEDTYWPAQLHNDWLETLITFGWAGSVLIAAAFAMLLCRWFLPGEIHGSRRLVILTWLAMAGCLAHARYDMPFQIYSILFLWFMLCAMLSTLTRHRAAS